MLDQCCGADLERPPEIGSKSICAVSRFAGLVMRDLPVSQCDDVGVSEKYICSGVMPVDQCLIILDFTCFRIQCEHCPGWLFPASQLVNSMFLSVNLIVALPQGISCPFANFPALPRRFPAGAFRGTARPHTKKRSHDIMYSSVFPQAG